MKLHLTPISSDSPFTELFSLLTFNDEFKSKYTTKQLYSLYLHSQNAIDAILRGLQDIGGFIGVSERQENVDMKNFGFFVSALANLNQVLNTLKSNVSYMLIQGGV